MRPLVLALLATACTLSDHPRSAWEGPTARVTPTLDLLRSPGPLEHTAVVSARWEVPRSGVLDLDAPAAQAAGLEDEAVPIVLPVHVFTHPTLGTTLVDSGAPSNLQDSDGPGRGLVSWMLDSVQIETPMRAILEDHPADRVLLTHAHLDHILGLVEVPHEVPVIAGPGELATRQLQHLLLRRTVNAAFGDRPALQTWPFEDEGVPLGPVDHALDVLGDGSLWALHVPGHTPGSTAYLARTVDGPVLLTGDCSHTRWGWAHDVTPGTFTSDHEANAHSLAALRELAADLGAEVYVGHEL